jgi:hypothetical protein
VDLVVAEEEGIQGQVQDLAEQVILPQQLPLKEMLEDKVVAEALMVKQVVEEVLVQLEEIDVALMQEMVE